MLIVLSLILIVTVAQLFLCHFTLWWLMSVVARLLFSLRRIGAVIPVKRLMITEAVSLGVMLITYLIFAKGNIPWSRMGLNVLCDAIACIVMWWDDTFMVYETVDIDEDGEEI